MSEFLTDPKQADFLNAVDHTPDPNQPPLFIDATEDSGKSDPEGDLALEEVNLAG